MIGLILCGGQSTRMGMDKGLLQMDGMSWAQSAAKKMASLDIPVYLSISEAQAENYANIFPRVDLITDVSSLDIRGPLSGLLTAHLQHPLEDIFVLACDMPLMHTSILQELREIYLRGEDFGAYVFIVASRPEPVCGIYTARSLALVLQLYNQQQLSRHGLSQLLEKLNACFVPVKSTQEKNFGNFNSPSSLDSLGER
jgi:molybdopterin-guanine dinucleotide biosynthesis protein A